MDLVLQLDWLQVYDNVLSEDYCNEIISKTTNNLSRQWIHPTGDYDMKAEGYRTSNQYFIPFNHDLDKKINECANKLTKINIDNFEQTSIIRYQKGQEYKPHYDHYDPKDEPTKQITEHWGNRIATAVFFLNGDFEGGETRNAEPRPFNLSWSMLYSLILSCFLLSISCITFSII